MNNQFVIAVEFGKNPVYFITGNDANASEMAADLSYDTHCKVALFCNLSFNNFPQHISNNTKSRWSRTKSNIPPFIFEWQSILQEAVKDEAGKACLPDYFSFLLRQPLIESSPNTFLNDSRKLNNIWN